MLYDDHKPSHFHAEYGEYRITVNIIDGVVEGNSLNKDNLIEDWELAEKHMELKKIPPLE